MLTEHEQIAVYYPTLAETIMVDKKIAPLLQELWRLGIDTLLSCEDNFGKVWICFETSFDAQLFLDLALPKKDELYRRATNPESDSAWTYRASPDDATEVPDENDEYIVSISPKPDIRISVDIRFPISDYPAVLENVKASARIDDDVNR